MITTKLAMIKTGLKIGVVLSLVAAAGFLFWQNRSLLEQRARQAVTILQQKAEIEDRQGRIEKLEVLRAQASRRAAAARAREMAIRGEVRELRYEIKQMEETSAAVRGWLDGDDMPDELYHLLRDFSARTGDDLPD